MSLVIERVENDLRQVVDDVTVSAAEACDEAFGVGLLRQRHRRQVDADRPAFGALVQRAQGLGGEAEVQDLVEEGRRLGLGEAEVGGTKFQQLLEGAQPSHRDRWIRTRRDNQGDVARRPLEEEAERVMADAIRDLLVVVEHQDELLADRLQVVQNSRDDRIDDIRARLTQRTQGRDAPLGSGVPDRLNDVGPERDRVVVPRVEREAGEDAAVDLAPLREQGRLSEPRRRSQQNESRRRLAQRVGAARALQSVTRGANPFELPLEEDPVVEGGTCESIGRRRRCRHGDSTLIQLWNAGDCPHCLPTLLRNAASLAHEGPRGNTACTELSVVPAPGVRALPSKVATILLVSAFTRVKTSAGEVGDTGPLDNGGGRTTLSNAREKETR